jgi:hypothetical protein
MATERKRAPTSTTRHGNGAGGPGWGGPAKGASTARRKPLAKAGPGRGYFSAAGEERRERQERLIEELCALYWAFAHDPNEPAPTRISAATHLLNRLDGLPVAKVITADADDLSDLTSEDIKAQLETYERFKWLDRALGMTDEKIEAEIGKDLQRIRGFVASERSRDRR